jgi:hypothetical protein
MLHFSRGRCVVSSVQTLDTLRTASAAALLASILAFGASRASEVAEGATPGSEPIATPRAAARHLWRPGALAWSRDKGSVPVERSFSPTAVIHPGTLKATDELAMPGRLLSLMQSEALRDRRKRPVVLSDTLDPSDQLAEEERARRAERIVTRAFNRTLDERLDHLARTSLGLSGLLAWMDDVGEAWPGLGDAPSAAGGSPRGDPTGARRSGDAAAFRANLVLKLDARPRLVLRTSFLGIRGRIEAAPSDEPIRLNFERALGPRSHAALRGGVARDGRDWATFTLNFSF